MESDGLWKARPKAAAFPQPLENAPRPPPAFPTHPTAPASDVKRDRQPPQNQLDFINQVTLSCWHLSDAGLVALAPDSVVSPLLPAFTTSTPLIVESLDG